jgi:hypothetical protein
MFFKALVLHEIFIKRRRLGEKSGLGNPGPERGNQQPMALGLSPDP